MMARDPDLEALRRAIKAVESLSSERAKIIAVEYLYARYVPPTSRPDGGVMLEQLRRLTP